MPFNQNGEFYFSPGTAAVKDKVAYSAHVNQRFEDVKAAQNTPRPVLYGGTGAGSASAARANLGVRAATDTPSLAGGNTFGGVTVFNERVDISRGDMVKLRLMGSAQTAIEAYNAGGTRTGMILFDNEEHIFRVFLDAGGGQPSARMDLTRAGVLSVNGNAVYHAGNKPTAADVGALPASGKATDADRLDGLDSAAFQQLALVQDVANVGAIAFLRSAATASVGAAYAGSTLTVAGVTSAGAMHVGATVMAGQWRALGACPAGGATLFIKIS